MSASSYNKKNIRGQKKSTFRSSPGLRQFAFHPSRAAGSRVSQLSPGAAARPPVFNSGPSAMMRPPAPRGRYRKSNAVCRKPWGMAVNSRYFHRIRTLRDLSRTRSKSRAQLAPEMLKPIIGFVPPPDVGSTRSEKSHARKSATPPLQVLWRTPPSLPAAPYSSLFPPRDLSDSTCPSGTISGHQR